MITNENLSENYKPNEWAPEKAQRLGLELVEPKPNEIFIDLDSWQAVEEFEDRLELLKKIARFEGHEVKWSKSQGGKWHAIITFFNSEFSPLERIIMQAVLGSDPMREILALLHARDGYPYLSVFFEKPGVEWTDKPHGMEIKQPAERGEEGDHGR